MGHPVLKINLKSKYSSCPIETTAHHKAIDDKCGRFVISKVLQDASSWTTFGMNYNYNVW